METEKTIQINSIEDLNDLPIVEKTVKIETHIPIYRGQKIDSDEYVEGDFVHTPDNDEIENVYQIFKRDIVCGDMEIAPDIDPSTLAIHFPSMIDSEGTKIFASLSEDGKGGDISSNGMFVFIQNSRGTTLMNIKTKELCDGAKPYVIDMIVIKKKQYLKVYMTKQ